MLTSATGNDPGEVPIIDVRSANGRTIVGNSSASGVTLADVKGALTGLKGSLSSAATKVASSVSTAVSGATSGITGAVNGAATSSIEKLSDSVTELVKGLS